ncbi:MAG: hypothetical protein NZ700_07685 [Gemmataceae bacterium]|nr:hypothetical protein [Gemmataceae bacterium]MDW8267280.1 hypothetical protein [Gemmataceae bacterium]
MVSGARIGRSCMALAVGIVLLGGNLAFGQVIRPVLPVEVNPVAPAEPLPAKLDRERLKQMRQQIQEVAKKLHEAADKEDDDAIEVALRELDKLIRELVGPKAGGGGNAIPRIIINGQEIKPGDPRFPRIRVVPAQPPVPLPEREDKGGKDKPEKK